MGTVAVESPAPDTQTLLAELYLPVAQQIEQVRRMFDQVTASRVDFVNDLCRHVRHYRGKMLRPLLLLLGGRACGELGPEHVTLATVVEMVHIATLVHDDVLDEARMRRRTRSVNARWGNEASVLLGDYLISQAFHLCSSIGSQEASQLIGATTNTVCEGELLEIAHRGDLELDEPTYLQIIRSKTAVLISACCVLGAKWAGATPPTVAAMEQYGLCVGIAFQIEDDLLDITGQEGRCGKSLGRDLDKGTITLPVIQFLREAPKPDRRAMLQLLSNGQAEQDRRDQVRRLLTSFGSLRYARAVADRYVQNALDHLSVLPESPVRACLQAVARFTIHREH